MTDRAVPPSCKETGLTEGSHCGVCNEILTPQTEVSKTPHIPGEWETAKEPAKTENGKSVQKCSSCGEILDEKPIPATGSLDLKYSLNGNGSYTVSKGNCTDTEIVIPSVHDGKAVTAIAKSAFENCTTLTSIVIPDSVTSIGAKAFYGCEGLTEISVSASNTKYSSENGVLFNKNKTELICYPAGKADASYSIPSGVTSIGQQAFYNCIDLKSVVIPDSVTVVGYEAFYYCKALQSVDLGNGVKTIESRVFRCCDKLKSITIPTSVTSIGDEVFFETGLITVEIPDNVTSLGKETFKYCHRLQKAIIGDGVTTLGYGTFWACNDLTTVELGDRLETIGEGAFKDCWKLASLTIPSSVSRIENYAFIFATNLKSIQFNGTKEQWGNINRYYYWNYQL